MDVRLPKLGEGADSGVVVALLVKDGDEVSEGETLLELENEKAVAPIPAPASGTISSIRVKNGDRVSIGQVLMTIGSAGSVAATPASEETSAEVTKTKKVRVAAVRIEDEDVHEEDENAAAKSGAKVAAAPSIRRLARELGIDLTQVRGRERGGRIVMEDLRAYILQLQKQASQPGPTAGSSSGRTKEALVEAVDFSRWGEISKKPLSQLRKVISRRMTENWNTIPHVTQFDEADVTALTEWRKKYAGAYDAKGARLTLTSFVLKAVAATLQQHPIFNASLDEVNEEIVFKEYYHIGLAVDTDAGLLVPVIRDVNKKDLVRLSKEVAELAAKARDRKVLLDELKGGTFTISNQGGIGGAQFTPIVNKPEVAILGLGRSALKPVVREGKIESRLMLPIAVSYDHRVIDGGSAARFTVDLVKALENFSETEVMI